MIIRLPRSNWLLVLLIAVAAALGAAALRAAAQSVMTGPRAPSIQAAAAPADQAKSSDQAKPSDQASPPAGEAKAPAGQASPPAKEPPRPAAPEIHGSADNNVSFPVDI